MAGTIRHASRRANNIAADGRDGYLLLVNNGDTILNGTQIGRDYSVGKGEAALVSASEALQMAALRKECLGERGGPPLGA